MTLEKLLEVLTREKEVKSRFPVRIVLTDSLQLYRQFIQTMTLLCDEVFELAAYCDGADTFPRLEKLQENIVAARSKSVLVLSMAEYLRLGYRRELPGTERAQFSALFNMQQDCELSKKVYIPLYACEQIFEQIIGQIDERHMEHVWRLKSHDSEHEKMELQIYSAEFKSAFSEGGVIYGVKNWLKTWDKGIALNRYTLITKRHSRVEESCGVYSVSKVTNLFSHVVQNCVDGNRLNSEWGSDDQWGFLARYISRTKTVSDSISELLNMIQFDSLPMLAKWQQLSGNEKWSFWLWHQINAQNDYLGFAIRNTPNFLKIPQAIINAIFQLTPAQDEKLWISQRADALNILYFDEMGDDFWDRWKAVPDLRKRLLLLSFKTHEERAAAIKTVSELLRSNVGSSDVISLLKGKYELLSDYLLGDYPCKVKEIKNYFAKYKEQKLRNEYDPEMLRIVDETPGIMDDFDTRFSVLQKHRASTSNVYILWIDGMGAEWTGLLTARIRKLNSSISIDSAIGLAKLPTETETNNQWDEMSVPYQKLDRLDKLAHKGEPDDTDYFSCIAKQLNFIDEVAKLAVKQLAAFEKVIITADHGTSRMAALAFHKLAGVLPPEGATVKSFGRYCELGKTKGLMDQHPSVTLQKRETMNYLVFKTHEHYKQSANAAGKNDEDIATVGEIHGGASPEECLIPVVAIAIKMAAIGTKQDYDIVKTEIKPNSENYSVIPIKLKVSTKTLQVTVNGIKAVCKTADGILWDAFFQNLLPGNYKLEVIADNKLLERQLTFTIQRRGIVVNDDL